MTTTPWELLAQSCTDILSQSKLHIDTGPDSHQIFWWNPNYVETNAQGSNFSGQVIRRYSSHVQTQFCLSLCLPTLMEEIPKYHEMTLALWTYHGLKATQNTVSSFSSSDFVLCLSQTWNLCGYQIDKQFERIDLLWSALLGVRVSDCDALAICSKTHFQNWFALNLCLGSSKSFMGVPLQASFLVHFIVKAVISIFFNGRSKAYGCNRIVEIW